MTRLAQLESGEVGHGLVRRREKDDHFFRFNGMPVDQHTSLGGVKGKRSGLDTAERSMLDLAAPLGRE